MSASIGWQRLSLAAIAASLIPMAASPASAFSFSRGGTSVPGQGQFSSVSGVTTIDFESGAPTSGFATYSTANGPNPILSGAGSFRPMADNASHFLSVAPTSGGLDNPTTIEFAEKLDYFGLYWGSTGWYDSIEFYNGSTQVASFTGEDVSGIPGVSGNWTDPEYNMYVNFFAETGESFDKIVLNATHIAFETDNHAYRVAAVPEPSAVLGLLGLGAIAAGSLKKRQEKSSNSVAKNA
ncbi:MAG: PEP-CTERM sorting domain-containing protein [Oscillatoria sp. SIO1A7]|nr:PEP-CTERM sorting domain-containing protein [Oscillatoria sp. SIO1A7]